MSKTYIAIEAKTGRELFRGNLQQWDRFFSMAHSRLGAWIVKEDSRAQKVVHFHPLSPAAAVAFMNRPATKAALAA